MITGFATALVVYLIFLLVSVLMFKTLKPKSPVRAMALLLVLCLPLVLAVHPWLQQLSLEALLPEAVVAGLGACFVFSFFVYIAIQAYSVVEASITVRILVHFLTAPDGRLSMSQLLEIYPFGKLIEGKIDCMVRDQMLSEERGDAGRVFVATPKGRLMGGVFAGIKSFLNWGAGG